MKAVRTIHRRTLRESYPYGYTDLPEHIPSRVEHYRDGTSAHVCTLTRHQEQHMLSWAGTRGVIGAEMWGDPTLPAWEVGERVAHEAADPFAIFNALLRAKRRHQDATPAAPVQGVLL